MIAETININFSKNKWQSAEWQEVRNPRFNYPGVMIQKDDHIVNKTPDVSAEEVFKKHCVDVFASMVMRRKFESDIVTISSEMSFDYNMAPLIVIAENLGKNAEGIPEYREHYEIVLFNEGINIWRYSYADGKLSWELAAFVKHEFLPQKRYELKVNIKDFNKSRLMTVECDGIEFGLQDKKLPKSFYAGITGCEGRNRFYNFKVNLEQKNKK